MSLWWPTTMKMSISYLLITRLMFLTWDILRLVHPTNPSRSKSDSGRLISWKNGSDSSSPHSRCAHTTPQVCPTRHSPISSNHLGTAHPVALPLVHRTACHFRGGIIPPDRTAPPNQPWLSETAISFAQRQQCHCAMAWWRMRRHAWLGKLCPNRYYWM